MKPISFHKMPALYFLLSFVFMKCNFLDYYRMLYVIVQKFRPKKFMQLLQKCNGAECNRMDSKKLFFILNSFYALTNETL